MRSTFHSTERKKKTEIQKAALGQEKEKEGGYMPLNTEYLVSGGEAKTKGTLQTGKEKRYKHLTT